MTELGQMLYNDGLADGQGLSQGISQGIRQVVQNSIGVIPDDAILAITGITPEQLQELKEEKESENLLIISLNISKEKEGAVRRSLFYGSPPFLLLSCHLGHGLCH